MKGGGGLWGCIWQQIVANLIGAPATMPGLFFAFVVASAVSWGLITYSWSLLALRSRLVRGYSLWLLWCIEMASVATAALGHFVLLFFVVYRRLPLGALLRCLRRRGGRRGGGGSSARRPVTCTQDSRCILSEDCRDASSFDEELEGRVGIEALSVTAAVGSVGGLQQRSTTRLPASASDQARQSASGSAPLLGDADDLNGVVLRSTSLGARKQHACLAHYFSYVVAVVTLVIFLIHWIVHMSIPDAHRQSQEIVIGMLRVSTDAVLLTAYEFSIALRLEKTVAQSSRGGDGSSCGPARVSYVRITLYVCVFVVTVGIIYVLSRFLYLVFTVDTIAQLKNGVLESFDICAMEGMRMDPALAKSWVWPALMHRRFFNFWTGSENCTYASGLPPISYLDADEHVLLVSPQCHDGTRPRVYLHRPENNEFTGSPDVKLPETKRGNLEYQRQLEALFGTPAQAASWSVVVHRNPVTKLILSVEVDPATLTAHPREPRTREERVARRLWPHTGNSVFAVPLGWSAAYTVLCEALQHEEYHLFPLDDDVLDAYSANVSAATTAQCVPDWKRAGRSFLSSSLQRRSSSDEPAGNVFILLFDAVSRQEIYRSLPKLRRALGEFANDSATGYYAFEAKGAMTLGVNTASNMLPFMAGITARAMELPNEVEFSLPSLINRAVFVKAKEKYGDSLSTALTSAFCHDLFEYLIGYTVPSSGAGGRVSGIDRYMYQPFCHMDYSGVHSNFKGPYSIIRRCMAGRAVWDHMVNYTEAVVQRQLEGHRRAQNDTPHRQPRNGDCDATMPEGGYGKHFFHIMYMTEGHEGTHGVIPLVDDSLTRFFLDLRFKLRFFDNPLNTFLLLADHGNHMGHYFEYTSAGRFERGTPPTVLLIHPEVLRRIDANKGRDRGIALQHLTQRTKRLSTPLDIYLTLADLLNVHAEVYDKYNVTNVIHPASLFDTRDSASMAQARKCSQFSSRVEHYPCPLDFCRPV